jgi:GTPase SAR1 family protein
VRAAAAVIVCVDAASRPGLERLRTHWLPEVARLNPGAPVVVAVCKDDREERIDLGELREVCGGKGGVRGRGSECGSVARMSRR